MSNKISITDFSFQFSGYGHYKVTYRSPKTLKEYSKTTNNMPLIDETKNSENPKKVHLEQLKRLCKS